MGKPHLTAEQRAMALRLRANGLNFTEIGEQIDSSLQTAWNVIMKPPTRTVKPFSWSPGPGRLRLAEREEISLGLRRGATLTANGLLRQYMPRGTDLSILSVRDLTRIARSLNDRPRATLGFMKPSEKLAELLAHTP